MLKKAFTSFLLAVLIIHWTALPLLWQWRLADIRYEAGSRSTEGELQSLTISKKEWEQSRIGKKEIRLAGNMYDVKSIHFAGDAVNITVKRDYKEDRLLKTGEYLTHHKSTEHPGNVTDLPDIFHIVYLVPAQQFPFIVAAQVSRPALADVPTIFTGRTPGCPDQPPQIPSIVM